MTHEWTDRELYQAFCGSDGKKNNQASEILLNELRDYVKMNNIAVAESHRDIEDLLQETLKNVFAKCNSIEDPTHFRRYIRETAKHIAINWFEQKRRQNSSSIEDEQIETVSNTSVQNEQHSFSAQEQLAELIQLFRQVPISEESRVTILKKYIEDLSDEEIAAYLIKKQEKRKLRDLVQKTRSTNFKKIRESSIWRKRFEDLLRS